MQNYWKLMIRVELLNKPSEIKNNLYPVHQIMNCFGWACQNAIIRQSNAKAFRCTRCPFAAMYCIRDMARASLLGTQGLPPSERC